MEGARRLAAILVLLASAALASASSFQFGTGAYFESSGDVEGFDLCIWGLMLEPRISSFGGWFAFEAPLTMGFDEDLVEFAVRPAMLLSIPLADSIRIDAGLGTEMQISLHTDNTWEVNDGPYVLTGEAFGRMTLDYRIGFMLDFGDVAMRIATRLPTSGTFTDIDMTPDWDEGEVGASLLVDIV